MRSRRVPVLKLGSRGPGGDARSLRCVRKAFAKRSQRVRKAFAKRSRRVGHAGETNETKIVAKCRTVVSLLDSSRVFASQKCQQSQGSGGVVVAKPRTVDFWTRLGCSRLKSVNSHRDRGGRGFEAQNCRHFWTRLGCSRLKSVNSHRNRGGRGRETQNCRHFWTRRWREERGERREEKREMRGEKRREEWIEERREERGDRGEERRGEQRREEREERREDRGGKRERRGERG